MSHLLLTPILLLGACAGEQPASAVEASSPAPAVRAEAAAFALPLRLVGTEPFWGARVDGRTVVLSGVDRPTVTARILQGTISGRAIAYTAEAGSGSSFTAMAVALDNETCSDGMSDRTYPFKATVVVSSDASRPAETLRGCAMVEAEFIRGSRP